MKSTTNGLELVSGHPHVFSKPLFMLRGAVMHPGYRSSDWSQPGDPKTVRPLTFSLQSLHCVQNVQITLSF